MAVAGQVSFVESLLAPIPGDSPGGGALPDEDLFAIEVARHFDDGGGGVWERERKDPDWPQVRRLTAEAIAGKSKSLRLAAWFTEASASLDVLVGLTEGLTLMSGLIERFWDRGLLPPVQDGDFSYRALPIEGLNDKAAALLRQVPLAKRAQGSGHYTLIDYQQALKAGTEKGLIDANGNTDKARKKIRDEVIANGGITGELWQAGVSATPLSFYDSTSAALMRLSSSVSALVTLMDKKEFFGTVEAPSLREMREVIESLRKIVDPILKDKRKTEAPAAEQPIAAQPKPAPAPSSIETSPIPVLPGAALADRSWLRAEDLVRSGEVRAGLEEMTQLAAQEHGRSRFLRRLALAEICMQTGRAHLALVILEELAEQIKSLNLTAWESPELIGSVWGRLYREYLKAGDLKKERAEELYLSLCRLDPWQGLRWAVD